ncbi:MAG: hypothetical protein LBT23_08245, partial [Synergistaceae bacterium]|nr:hypothetical protein [Synergistaceae bacterium]
QKGEVADKFNAAEKSRRFYELTDALQSSIGYSRYGDSKKTEPDSKKIKEALSDFHRIAGEILLGSDGDIKKFGEEVQKSGRKISGARLSELKAAHAALSKIIDEADETPDSEGDVNVVKEELEKLIKNCVDEAVKPLSVKLEKLEKLERVEKEEDKAEPGASVEKGADDKTAAPETPPKDEALQKDELDIAAIVKAAISEAINPVSDRLEKLEKARGTRNSIPEESEVQKKNSIFSGAFVG